MFGFKLFSARTVRFRKSKGFLNLRLVTRMLHKNQDCMECQNLTSRPCDLCVISQMGMVANNHPALWEFLTTNSDGKKPPPLPSSPNELASHNATAAIHWLDQQHVQFCFQVEECYNSFNTYTDLLSPHNKMVRTFTSLWIFHLFPNWLVTWAE